MTAMNAQQLVQQLFNQAYYSIINTLVSVSEQASKTFSISASDAEMLVAGGILGALRPLISATQAGEAEKAIPQSLEALKSAIETFLKYVGETTETTEELTDITETSENQPSTGTTETTEELTEREKLMIECGLSEEELKVWGCKSDMEILEKISAEIAQTHPVKEMRKVFRMEEPCVVYKISEIYVKLYKYLNKNKNSKITEVINKLSEKNNGKRVFIERA